MTTKHPMPVQNFLDANTAGTPLPPLFASTKREFSGRARGGAIVKIAEGQRVRILRPYKSGDVGITTIARRRSQATGQEAPPWPIAGGRHVEPDHLLRGDLAAASKREGRRVCGRGVPPACGGVVG